MNRAQKLPQKLLSIFIALLIHLSCSMNLFTANASQPHIESDYEGQPTATPTSALPPMDGLFTFRAYIDGVDLLHIQGNQVWYEHLRYALPGKHEGRNEPTSINGENWMPSWIGSDVFGQQLTEKYNAQQALLPMNDGFYFKILTANARGHVKIVQIPSAKNSYEMILLLDDNFHGAADWYEFTLGWSKDPFSPEIVIPEPGSIYFEVVLSGFFAKAIITLQKDRADLNYQQFGTNVFMRKQVFNSALPFEPVQLNVHMIDGNEQSVGIIQQPRPENNYTAQIAIESRTENENEYTFYITWDPFTLPPTPTPWPSFNPAQPTPTPIPSGQFDKVLWIISEQSTSAHNPIFSFNEFKNIFASMGAQNVDLPDKDQAITDELLQGYQVVIFGSDWVRQPLSENEQGSVQRFVSNGGSILVLGEQQSLTTLQPQTLYASSIVKSFGIEFSVHINGSVVYLREHPLLQRVIDLNANGSRLIVNSPAIPLASVKDQISREFHPILAVAEIQYGRVMAFSNVSVFYGDRITPSEPFYSPGQRRFVENVPAWLLRKEKEYIPPMPTPTPTLVPSIPSDPSAEVYLDRVLKANLPWLDPKPIKAQYNLLRSGEVWGPYSIDGGGAGAKRVGSIFITSLHLAYKDRNKLTVELIGKAEKQGIMTDVLELHFSELIRESVGFGGQTGMSFSHGDFSIRASQIYVHPTTLTPLLIESSEYPWEQNVLQTDINTWEFSPEFIELDGGYVPTEFIYNRPTFVKERQSFQIVNGIWIFKEGESWYGELISINKTGWIQSVQLVDLTISEVRGVTSIEDWVNDYSIVE